MSELEMSQGELDELLQYYMQLSDKIKELEKAKDKVKIGLEIQLKGRNLDNYQDEKGNTVRFHSYQRRGIDNKKIKSYFEERNMDISPFETITEIKALRVERVKNVEVDQE